MPPFPFLLSTSCLGPPFPDPENPWKAPTVSARYSAARYFVLVFGWLAVRDSCPQGTAGI
jgi:hypothetical protein